MKLLNLLLQELPKQGGWPVGVKSISTHADGIVFFDGKIQNHRFYGVYCSNGWRPGMPHGYTNAVQKEQYEAALAASKQTEWDGEGLPPVGCECEAFDGVSWFPVVIVGRYDGFAFAWNYDHRKTLTVNEVHSVNFRPIRTETERKREEVIKEMTSHVTNFNKTDVIHALAEVYDAIAAGNIKGLKVE